MMLKRSLCEARDARKLQENQFQFCTLSTKLRGKRSLVARAYAEHTLFVLAHKLNQRTNTHSSPAQPPSQIAFLYRLTVTADSVPLAGSTDPVQNGLFFQRQTHRQGELQLIVDWRA